jgi:hypothetical protein
MLYFFGMDNQEQKLLEDIKKLSFENHEMLRKLRGTQKNEARRRFFSRIFFVVIILGLAYLIYPYLNDIQDAYEALVEARQSLEEARDALRQIGT